MYEWKNINEVLLKNFVYSLLTVFRLLFKILVCIQSNKESGYISIKQQMFRKCKNTNLLYSNMFYFTLKL